MVHDSKHSGNEITPVPHASTWFAHIRDPNKPTNPDPEPQELTIPNRTRNANQNVTTSSKRQQQAISDADEVAIRAERSSIRCPLTFLPFKDPVTSTKCPHSFERAAIEDMIRTCGKRMTIPAANGNGRRRV